MKRTYREILEGCKYYEKPNKRERAKKKIMRIQSGKQPALPFPENEASRVGEEKGRK